MKNFTEDQVRRIFRDFLKGVPKEKLMKKWDIPASELDSLIESHRHRRHPNDVGGAPLREGMTLVDTKDTGSQATENPIKATSSRDLRAKADEGIAASHVEKADGQGDEVEAKQDKKVLRPPKKKEE